MSDLQGFYRVYFTLYNVLCSRSDGIVNTSESTTFRIDEIEKEIGIAKDGAYLSHIKVLWSV